MTIVTIRITDVNGKAHVFKVSQDSQRSIMDIAQDEWVELPYSCRSGACYSCCATVHQGKAYLEQNKTGEQLIDVEPDEFLCCIGGIKPEAFAWETSDEASAPTIELTMLN